MRTPICRSLVPIIAGAILALTAFVGSGSAHAQCATPIRVTNNAGCDLQLCLYDPTWATYVCWNIPTGGPTFITFPAGFNPAGGVSAGGNTYPFSLTGCTVCYSQITTTPVKCCAEVCYDRAACTITIRPCTGAVCHP